ncbi:alpha-L-arabinofuranosidase C-terminal domain-containing protein, partial [Pseudomonas sp. FW306-02-F02-AB]|uniref:alpha-L-arabinofuranosidase C-terminal domain-containing protein n=1 Tax=Pseudomonas sp. FW306-02-F02-AB TaxID=2070653 RepID=UPI000CBF0B6E
DSIKIANIAQIVNVIAPIMTRGDQMVLQTIFHPFEMFSKRRTGKSLRIVVDGPTYGTKKFGAVDLIDSSAILNGNELNVFLVNRDLESKMEV